MTTTTTLNPEYNRETDEFYLNMGPQHPSTHGVLRLELKMDGEVINEATPHIGYLHRSMEKMMENRTYMQIIPLTDRLDYIASMSNNLAYVMAVEKLMGVVVPERAQYIRIILVELQRIASHLLGVGTFAQDLGAFGTPLLYCFREREKIIDIYEEVCGNRLTYSYFRFGGVARDVPDTFSDMVQKYITYILPKINDLERLLTNNVIFLNRTKGVGVISPEQALTYAISGPNIRGSGIKWDIRKAEPYSLYERFDFDVPIEKNGDCWDRYKVRIEEMRQSVRIVEQAIKQLPGGEINALKPMAMRYPKPEKGSVYFRTEAPRGDLGFYIVSDGTDKPYRVKVRAPSFSNLAILPELMKGLKIADVVAICGSLDIVMGEIDR
ncbi:MAG: NADH-quinone oxidoreductase subunit D [Candidatus Ancaeobacter aquaticus]|nr:NADH-quinone oxidoreductase subunit D [Candidatus Ancaeobacter aquaticus]